MISIKPLKILLVVTLSETGGAQKVVYHIAAGLEPGLFDVTVACAPGGELVRWLRELAEAGESAWSGETGPSPRPFPLRVVEIPELKREIAPARDLLALWRLYRLIRRERFDVVHCHSSKAGLLGRLAAWLAGAPRVYFTAHGWGINEYQTRPFRFFFTLAERLAGAVSTRVVCVSRYDYDKALALKLARPGKLAVVYNGLPETGEGFALASALAAAAKASSGEMGSAVGSEHPASSGGKVGAAVPAIKMGQLKKELGLAGSDLLVVTVMRLAPPKEPLLFLEVARELVQPVPGLYFAVIGDGPLRTSCEAFIRENGLVGRVFMTGAREDAAELINGCDLFVHFSRWEGLTLTIIEAMLAGVPVVANRVGGAGELVADGETGLLINELDLRAARRACEVLLGSGELRRRYGEAGRQRARRLFSLEEMQRKYRELYLQTLV